MDILLRLLFDIQQLYNDMPENPQYWGQSIDCDKYRHSLMHCHLVNTVYIEFSQQAYTSRKLYRFQIHYVTKEQIQFSKDPVHIQFLSYETEYVHVLPGTVAHMLHWVYIPFCKWRSPALTWCEVLAFLDAIASLV